MLPPDTAKVIINSLSVWSGRLMRGCIAFTRALSAKQYTSLSWVSGNQAWNSNPGHGDARTGNGWWISDPGIRIPTWIWCVGSSAKLGQSDRGVLHSAQRLSIQRPSSSCVVTAVYLKTSRQRTYGVTLGAFPYKLLTWKSNSTFPLPC